MNYIAENRKTDVSQKFKIAGIINWQHDNGTNRSSSPHTIEETNNVESLNNDINIQSILNEGANYKMAY